MNELRDLFDEIETLMRTAKGALTMDTAAPEAIQIRIEEATGDLDQAMARIERGRIDGVVPQ